MDDFRQRDDIREQLLRYMGQAARQDTPEWKFDRDEPDVGTALACVYADLFSETLERLERVWDKHRVEFFNSLDAQVLPPVPANGYVLFQMVNDAVQGVEVPAGMRVYADTQDGEVAFRTLEDVYATSAEIQAIYQVQHQKDRICRLYRKGQELHNLHLFDEVGENLQQHVLYLGFDNVLHIGHEAWIFLYLYRRGGLPLPQQVLQYFSDETSVTFSCDTEQGLVQLHPHVLESGALEFHIKEKDLPFIQTEVEGHSAFWLRCQVHQMAPFAEVLLEQIQLSTKSSYLLPDFIYGNGLPCDPHAYSPFGERFGLYHTAYFACAEALSKRGSDITFSFCMDFIRVSLTDVEQNSEIAWDWIMKKSDFAVDIQYDLTIEEVLWEYWNGSGWSRLFSDHQYADLFTTEGGLQNRHCVMHFICPHDICPVLVDSCASYYIRARIIKIQNLYKTKGYYVTPVLSDTMFTYNYGDCRCNPQWVITTNNLETQVYLGDVLKNSTTVFQPFHTIELQEDTIYVGLQAPIAEGPVKMLFAVEENPVGRHLRWEYYSYHGFQEANVVDETRGFSRTGIVTWMGETDFQRTTLFGQHLYWLRIVAEVEQNGRFQYGCTCIKDIYINVVKISHVDFEETQYFETKRYEENRQLTLLHPHVIEVNIWVDEAGNMSTSQLQQLQQQREVEWIYTPEGTVRHAWVKWDEVTDFVDATNTSRCFCMDRNAGIILFGNGRHGKMIPPARRENIRVSYQCGGGLCTNVPAGAICRMGRTIGFIRGVTNPYQLLGGCDQETVEQAMIRNAQLLRHHHRAVTAEDFEQLTLCAARNIKRVKCFTGRDANGNDCAGALTLVVMQQEPFCSRYVFHDLQEQIRQYLWDKMDHRIYMAKRFFIIQPEFVELHVRVEVIAQDFHAVFPLKKEMEQRLQCFLDPLHGHFDGHGWQIGTLPTMVQFQNLLRDVHGVRYIKNIYLSAFSVVEGKQREVDLKKVVKHPFVVPINGKHRIVVQVE